MKSVVCSVFALVSIASCCLAQTNSSDLGFRIAEVQKDFSGSGNFDTEAFEKRLLVLLENEKYKENEGVVFAEIAKFYCKDLKIHSKKAAFFAQKALAHKLDFEDTCQMYICLGDVDFIINNKDCHENDDKAIEKIYYYLKGLSFVLENLLIDDCLEIPGVEKFDVEPMDPLYKDVVLRNKEQLFERDRIMTQNLLLEYRDYFNYRIKEVRNVFKLDSTMIARYAEQKLTYSESQRVINYLELKQTP